MHKLTWAVALVCAVAWSGVAGADIGSAEADAVLARILELKATAAETTASALSGEMGDLQARYSGRTGAAAGMSGVEGVFQGPPNDLCDDAITVAVPSATAGTTTGAAINGSGTCTTAAGTSPDVYYRVFGTGNTMTASFCDNGGTAAYDSKITAYCDTCATLTCVAGNDDSCGLQSQVSWCSQAGFEYIILVHGFGGATGDFTLAVYDDGTPCPDPGICSIVPVELQGLSVE